MEIKSDIFVVPKPEPSRYCNVCYRRVIRRFEDSHGVHALCSVHAERYHCGIIDGVNVDDQEHIDIDDQEHIDKCDFYEEEDYEGIY